MRHLTDHLPTPSSLGSNRSQSNLFVTQYVLYFFVGCDGGFSKSCLLAGMFHRLKFSTEIQTEQNENTATKLFEKACDLDHPLGCYQYGSALIKDQNYKKALTVFEKSCESGKCHLDSNLKIFLEFQ